MQMTINNRISPKGYERDVRHYEFNTKGLKSMG